MTDTTLKTFRILLVLKRQAAGNLKAELLVMRKESGLAPQPLLLGIPVRNCAGWCLVGNE